MPPDPILHPSQAAAITYMRAQAIALKPEADDLLAHICRMSNIDPSTLSAAITVIQTHARVALHFHPDRPAASGLTVCQGLLEEGLYRSQFETFISNGLVGGARDSWEEALFGGAYHGPDGVAAHRPKYGALDLMRCPDGPAIRFGSCFLLLKPEVGKRCTFTFGGSQDLPKYRGTMDLMEPVLGAMMEECFVRDYALGVKDIRPANLMARFLELRESPSDSAGPASRNLDHCVEVQIHGDVRLDRDVEEIVADPSFKGGGTGEDLKAMSKKYGFSLRWHGGFRMVVEHVPLDFRGPAMPSIAARVARDGVVDAEAIGLAVREATRGPELWADRGTLPEVLQELKLLWHVLVRCGRPIMGNW